MAVVCVLREVGSWDERPAEDMTQGGGGENDGCGTCDVGPDRNVIDAGVPVLDWIRSGWTSGDESLRDGHDPNIFRSLD